MKERSKSFEDGPDSVDRKPTFEVHAFRRGQTAEPKLHAAILPFWDALHSFVRDALQCPGCEACSVLARRYLPSERRDVPPHMDVNAFATAVLTLNAHECRGGYYVETHEGEGVVESGPNHASVGRQLHLPLQTGDVLLHGNSIRHGVNVTQGERYSLVFWFKDRPGLCATDENPWILESAERGDADMAYMVSQLEKYPQELRMRMWHAAAAAGHFSMFPLMEMLYSSSDISDHEKATELARKAAEWGRVEGVIKYAWALSNGVGVRQDKAASWTWTAKAAELGHAESANLMRQKALFEARAKDKKRTREGK